jgi:HSP20 family protein
MNKRGAEMVLQRRDPINDLHRVEEMMNRLLRVDGIGDGIESWAIPVDVVREGDDIVVHASLAGVNREDIQVLIEDDVLTIKAESTGQHESRQADYLLRERRSGSFYRAVRLPDTVNTEQAQSTYDNGVLSIRFPKQESKKARRLRVDVGGGKSNGATGQPARPHE